MPWDALWELLALPQTCFVNLQYGDIRPVAAHALDELGVKLHDWPDLDVQRDLDDLAARISALDLVVAVPGLAAHLAGALGVPVLIPFTKEWGCWWITEGRRALWYPTTTILNARDGGWRGVVSRMRDAIDRVRAANRDDEQASVGR
jgi:hypothetical protein